MTFDELGASLRAERERRGLRIEDAADYLKISARHLRALEEGDGDALPHPAYARGFIRSYAAYLGMSPEEIHNALNGVTAAPEPMPPQQPAYAPEPAPAPRRRSGGHGGALLLVFLVLVAAGAYAGWRWGLPMLSGLEKERLAQPAPPLSSARPAPTTAEAARGSQTSAERPAVQPQQGSEAATPAPAVQREETPAATTAQAVASRTDPVRTEAARTEPASAGTSRAEPPRAEPVRTELGASGTSGAAATTGGVAAPAGGGDTAAPGQHKVIITATEECWIHSNADKTDTRQFSLRKGDTFALTFARSLELKLGNAGGVRIRYDGQSMPPPGQSGQVRTLTFPPQAGQ